jgi:hypothetical protein
MGKRFMRIATVNGEYTARLACEMITLPISDPSNHPWVVELRSPYAWFLVRGPEARPALTHVDFPFLLNPVRRAPLNELAEAALAASIFNDGGTAIRVWLSRTEGGEGTPLVGGSFKAPAGALETLGSMTTLHRCAVEFGLDVSAPVSLREVDALRHDIVALWGGLFGGLTPRVGRFNMQLDAPWDEVKMSRPVAIVVRGAVTLGDHVMAAAAAYIGRAVRERREDGSEGARFVDPEYCPLLREAVPAPRFSSHAFEARVSLAAMGLARSFVVFELEGSKVTPRRLDRS